MYTNTIYMYVYLVWHTRCRLLPTIEPIPSIRTEHLSRSERWRLCLYLRPLIGAAALGTGPTRLMNSFDTLYQSLAAALNAGAARLRLYCYFFAILKNDDE